MKTSERECFRKMDGEGKGPKTGICPSSSRDGKAVGMVGGSG